MFPADLIQLTRQVQRQAGQQNAQIVTAESCTGGLLAAILTEIPGASAHFLGGYVAYANEVKTSLLSVPESMLEAHGAVSEPVARQMAQGALTCFPSATMSIAVTGIAGPEGGCITKPVGLVWIACAQHSTAIPSAAGRSIASTSVPTHSVQAVRHVFSGDRALIRLHTVREALRLIQSQLATYDDSRR